MFAGKSFELPADFFLAPALPLADLAGIHLGGAQRVVVSAEVAYGSGVQTRVFLLHRAAVQWLTLAKSAFQLKDDAVFTPLAVLADVVGIQTRAVQGAIPTAEQALLKRCER